MNIRIRDSLSISIRTYFSIQHVQSAAYFARETARIENDPASRKVETGRFNEQAYMEHKANVTASLFMAVSFLEATINELFADAADNATGRTWTDPSICDLFGSMWRNGVPRTASYSILDKYQIALTLARKTPFEPGQPPAQDVALLVKLRNALIHYEPETVLTFSDNEENQVQPHRFEKMLRGRFDLNPLTGAGNPFFPDKCLGHGCARWALISSVKLTDEFFTRMGMTPTYDHVRRQLATE